MSEVQSAFYSGCFCTVIVVLILSFVFHLGYEAGKEARR